MDLTQTVPIEISLEAELVAAYPMLVRRLTFVVRDADEALRRLRDPSRAAMTISAALLDQRALAGIGNIWRNETLFAERVDPFLAVRDLDDDTLPRFIATARRLLSVSAGVAPGRVPMRVYGRTGRPCPRCGTPIRSAPLRGEVPRTTYWCPTCQRVGH